MPIKPRDLEGPFTKPLTRKRFRKETRGALRLAYGKAERGIDKEIKGSRLAQKRNRQYFQNYGQEIGGAAQRTAGAYGQAQGSVQQASARSADFAETLRQRMAKEAQEDAARRGVPYDPSGSYTAADANLARINSANVLSGVTGAQGASQAAMFADKQRIGARESVEQQLREQARRRALQAEKREMAGDKAAQVSQMLGTARDQERDFYLGLKAAMEPGKERRQERKESAKGRRFDRKQSAKDRELTRSENAKDRAASTGGDKPSKEDRQETRADIQRVIGLLESTKPKKQKDLAYNKKKAIRAILNEGRSFSRKEAHKGYKKWRKKSGVMGPFQD